MIIFLKKMTFRRSGPPKSGLRRPPEARFYPPDLRFCSQKPGFGRQNPFLEGKNALGSPPKKTLYNVYVSIPKGPF